MARKNVEFLMFDVGLGLRLLTPRTLKEIHGMVRNGGYCPAVAVPTGVRGRPGRGYGAECEGSNVRKKSY